MRERPLTCGELMKRLNELMIKTGNSELQSQDITFSQMKVLVMLEHSEGYSATLKEIERHFEVAQATVAGIAIRLERKGMVESYMDAADRRIKHIRLTEKGLELLQRTRESIDRSEAWLVSPLDEDEKEELHRLLQKIYDSIHCDKNTPRMAGAPAETV